MDAVDGDDEMEDHSICYKMDRKTPGSDGLGYVGSDGRVHTNLITFFRC